MIVVDLNVVFKVLSLICSGGLILAYFIGSFTHIKSSFLNMLITCIFLILPFTYILLN